MGTLQPQSNGPLYSNMVIGTLAIDGWAVAFDTARRGLGGLWPRPYVPYRCTKCNSPSINGHQLYITQCGTIIAFAQKVNELRFFIGTKRSKAEYKTNVIQAECHVSRKQVQRNVKQN